MFKEKLENIKSMVLKKGEGNNKKNIENLVVFLIILIVTIIAINTIWKEDKTAKPSNETNSYKQLATTDTNVNSSTNEETYLESNLEKILNKINGVGKVNVLVTYSESSQVVAMYNENLKESSTEETDQTGGIRKIVETDTTKDVIYKEENGKKTPITQKVIMPKIEGAIITAEGAYDANVKANIIQAVEAATGLATHKIQVFQMRAD